MVPQGGNTGLVGGSVPDAGSEALVLSLTRLKAIRRIDIINNTITAEAGCVLSTLQEAAREQGRLFPLSLASEGSCTLGGNLSTNAGGVQVLRYGNARELCLGIEVVTADGQVWSSLRGLRKDNTGYDLRNLFIGAEGTLGIITAATMKLYPAPDAQLTAVVAVPDIGSALRLLHLAQSRLSASLTAFELMDARCIGLGLRHFPHLIRVPFSTPSAYSVLLESSDSRDMEQVRSEFESLLSAAAEEELVLDGAIASSIDQARAFWRLRELAAEAQVKEGPNFKHDIALPLSALDTFVAEARKKLRASFPECDLVIFGHLGDGNLHFNVLPPPATDAETYERLEPHINRIVYDLVHSMDGTISAEHGLGRAKIGENERYKSTVELELFRRIKKAFDPHGLMNPGRVLRASCDTGVTA